MRYLKMFAVLLVPLVLLALAGCGSDSSTVGSPFSSGVTGGGGGGTAPIGSGTVLSYNLVLKLNPCIGDRNHRGAQ